MNFFKKKQQGIKTELFSLGKIISKNLILEILSFVDDSFDSVSTYLYYGNKKSRKSRKFRK